MTLRQAFVAARERLAAIPELAGTAVREAAMLVAAALDLPRTTLYTHPARLLNEGEQAAVDAWIARRLAFEPIQYITGRTEFFGLELAVGPAVLIPRPETEGLVEAALARLPSGERVRIVDVGTGSGAIAIAVAAHRPQAEILAVDLSPAALAVARGNAERLGLADRVHFAASDLLSAVAVDARFEAILANLPYVPEIDRASLHPEVREWEPQRALFAGPDGLHAYRRLIPQAQEHLAAGGLLAIEIGAGQLEAAAALLDGWRGVQALPDLQGIPRVLVARRG